MKIELGGGHLLTEGFTNLDPVHGEDLWKRFAQDVPWPVEYGTVEAVRASHVMEHIPAGQERIAVMNEAHKVLVPNGTFEIIVPLIVARGAGEQLAWQAIGDPTHVSYWVMESFHYFDGTFAANADYGILLWKTVSFELVNGWEAHWIGRPQ